MTTKALVKTRYISELQSRYEFYTPGSRPLELAKQAIDKALSGQMKLKGDAWDATLKGCGLSPRITMAELANLPE